MAYLTIVGARQHNLKEVSLELEREKLVVITGPSGSGKSSLAFDTVYAEGQRRYVESLSAYARQFLEQLPKPDVESIDGLSPAIAIEQRALAKNPRSTVGTVTEIADYLRVLYARAGIPHCPECGSRIEAQSAEQIVDQILALEEKTRATLLAPVCRGRKGELKLELERLRREGYVRVRIDGEVIELGDDIVLDRNRTHDLDVVVDRIAVRPSARTRITDSVELALKLGDGALYVDVVGEPEPRLFSERFACLSCGLSMPPIEPRMFSFNGPHGACPACDGLGRQTRIDPERVVADPTRSLRQGAILAWGRRGSVRLATETAHAVKKLGVDPDRPWHELPEEMRERLLFADPDTMVKKGRRKVRLDYEGIVRRLERQLDGDDDAREGEEEDEDDPVELGRFTKSVVCEACGGLRLRPEALAVRLGGLNIAELGQLSLPRVSEALAAVLDDPTLRQAPLELVEPLVRAIRDRLGFLIDVGLSYLSLDRSARTLSGGEGQRIRLATQIGSALVGVLYVLDEPSVGLHAADNDRLLRALRKLVDVGNSVLVVEHDREAILAADWVVDMGPGAGVHGGQIVAQGPPAALLADRASITGPYLSGAKGLSVPTRRKRPKVKEQIRIVDATTHNLTGVTVTIPRRLLVAITGVSGSGKSSLVIDVLLPAAKAHLYGMSRPPDGVTAVEGLEAFDKVISIDQAPIGRTPRSNPATYTGLFGALRDLFASLPDARARGYKAGRFSFNVKGGRCESCQGDGVRRIEMHFLPDVFVQCDVCEGRRYNRETLEVQYRGMSIADVLELTVDEAIPQFEAVPKIRDRLQALSRVGLGYLTLGQGATTLSGGEAQRIKLARELAKRATGNTLYVLDEPTTGLHFSDTEMLMVALESLRDAGNTVLVIEHNVDLVAACDWVIDMGPGGGEHGGRVVGEGTPEQIAEVDSPTGRVLRDHLTARGGTKKKTNRKKARRRAST